MWSCVVKMVQMPSASSYRDFVSRGPLLEKVAQASFKGRYSTNKKKRVECINSAEQKTFGVGACKLNADVPGNNAGSFVANEMLQK